MHIARAPHRWTVTPKQAVAIQTRLAPLVRQEQPTSPIRLVAGADLAFTPDGSGCLAAVVLWDMLAGAVVEHHVARRPVSFPYVPGLLSFREAPCLLAALRKLRRAPDVLMCDGQGLAHPRRFGLACHVGVIMDFPTIGCAKSRLIGVETDPGARRGSAAPLVDRGETIGAVLRTRDGTKPVYVSVGHRMNLESAQRLVLACATQYRLPEPTRLADRLVARIKRQLPA